MRTACVTCVGVAGGSDDVSRIALSGAGCSEARTTCRLATLTMGHRRAAVSNGPFEVDFVLLLLRGRS